ncbi:hypothetical protein HDU93_005917 [Gonapodya sp. JEL0774]|nr:hypothetical protein HDU93_005917 [Gonapodya sp. JEL0774]
MSLEEFIEQPGEEQVAEVPSEDKIVQDAIQVITGKSIVVELDSEDDDGGEVEEVLSVSGKLWIFPLAAHIMGDSPHNPKYNTAVQAIRQQHLKSKRQDQHRKAATPKTSQPLSLLQKSNVKRSRTVLEDEPGCLSDIFGRDEASISSTGAPSMETCAVAARTTDVAGHSNWRTNARLVLRLIMGAAFWLTLGLASHESQPRGKKDYLKDMEQNRDGQWNVSKLSHTAKHQVSGNLPYATYMVYLDQVDKNNCQSSDVEGHHRYSTDAGTGYHSDYHNKENAPASQNVDARNCDEEGDAEDATAARKRHRTSLRKSPKPQCPKGLQKALVELKQQSEKHVQDCCHREAKEGPGLALSSKFSHEIVNAMGKLTRNYIIQNDLFPPSLIPASNLSCINRERHNEIISFLWDMFAYSKGTTVDELKGSMGADAQFPPQLLGLFTTWSGQERRNLLKGVKRILSSSTTPTTYHQTTPLDLKNFHNGIHGQSYEHPCFIKVIASTLINKSIGKFKVVKEGIKDFTVTSIAAIATMIKYHLRRLSPDDNEVDPNSKISDTHWTLYYERICEEYKIKWPIRGTELCREVTRLARISIGRIRVGGQPEEAIKNGVVGNVFGVVTHPGLVWPVEVWHPRELIRTRPKTITVKRHGINGFLDRMSSWLSDGKAQKVSENFIKRRRLGQKVANTFELYSFACVTVSVGFAGTWTLGLVYGWGSLLLSFLITTASFWASTLCWAEMTSALPFVGGPTTWSNAAFGAIGGMITGQLNIAFWVLSILQGFPATGYFVSEIFSVPIDYSPLYWLVAAILINIVLLLPVKWFFRAMAFSNICSFALLVLWFSVTVGKVDYNANVINGGLPDDQVQDAGYGGDLSSTFSFSGVIAGIVIATWFYTGIECLPHSSEEAIEIPKAISRSTNGFMITELVLGTLAIVVASGAAPGVAQHIVDQSPVSDNIAAALSISFDSRSYQVLMLVAFWPLFWFLVAGFYTLGRLIYSSSRGGYLPQFLSITLEKTGTPVVGQVVATVIVFVLSLILRYDNDPEAGMKASRRHGNFKKIVTFLAIVYEQLLNLLKALVYIRLAYKMPTLPRPYKSPLGLAGGYFAAATTLLSVISMLIFQPYTRLTIIIFAAHTAICVPYYIFYVKHRLLVTPEKQFLKEQLGYLFAHETGMSTGAESGHGTSQKRKPSTMNGRPIQAGGTIERSHAVNNVEGQPTKRTDNATESRESSQMVVNERKERDAAYHKSTNPNEEAAKCIKSERLRKRKDIRNWIQSITNEFGNLLYAAVEGSLDPPDEFTEILPTEYLRFAKFMAELGWKSGKGIPILSYPAGNMSLVERDWADIKLYEGTTLLTLSKLNKDLFLRALRDMQNRLFAQHVLPELDRANVVTEKFALEIALHQKSLAAILKMAHSPKISFESWSEVSVARYVYILRQHLRFAAERLIAKLRKRGMTDELRLLSSPVFTSIFEQALADYAMKAHNTRKFINDEWFRTMSSPIDWGEPKLYRDALAKYWDHRGPFVIDPPKVISQINYLSQGNHDTTVQTQLRDLEDGLVKIFHARMLKFVLSVDSHVYGKWVHPFLTTNFLDDHRPNFDDEPNVGVFLSKQLADSRIAGWRVQRHRESCFYDTDAGLVGKQGDHKEDAKHYRANGNCPGHYGRFADGYASQKCYEAEKNLDSEHSCFWESGTETNFPKDVGEHLYQLIRCKLRVEEKLRDHRDEELALLDLFGLGAASQAAEEALEQEKAYVEALESMLERFKLMSDEKVRQNTKLLSFIGLEEFGK